MAKPVKVEAMTVLVVIGLLGAIFLFFAAAVGGLGWWLLAGALIVVGIVATAIWAGRYGTSAPRDLPARRPRRTDGVHRVLVIADESCGPELRTFVRAHSTGPTQVRVLAPVVASGLSFWTGDEGSYSQAQTRLNETVATLRAAGIEADGKLGTDDPLRAADDGLCEFSADEILFALHGDDVVGQARVRYEIPVSTLG